ncbi:PREDICTED: relaxin-3 receptor 2 [Gekko japonicus]|uniref:Relaxin-3 receptor 2 n=1 Tax=Gekko japonicus TaxID=146911 RepID=A0ABM1JXV2_GEKJA|nr:PREDICTED: relaxin-3 receptor 2 [Gekko japonicus]
MGSGFQGYEGANSSMHQNELLWGSSDEAVFISSDASFGLRVFITFVYSVVCLMGLLGNGLAMYLIGSQKGKSTPIINIFIFGLAVADFQFSLTLPFWAAETALDFIWPFGEVMCKVVPSLTIISIYANVSLLTAMSVARYWTLASALKAGSAMTPNQAKWITVALWALALGASVPTVMFTAVQDIVGVKVCLSRFPTEYGLGIYRLHRVVFTFLIPLGIISASYVLLLRLLKTYQFNGSYTKRQKQVTTTIRLVVSSFFICWFPNHVATVWGVLVKFHLLPIDKAFFFLHNYIFPLTTCLAHASSCLNPILYCLMRNEFRKAIQETFWKLSKGMSSYCSSSAHKIGEEVVSVALPLSPSENLSIKPKRDKENHTFSSSLDLRTKETKLTTKVQLLTPGPEMTL